MPLRLFTSIVSLPWKSSVGSTTEHPFPNPVTFHKWKSLSCAWLFAIPWNSPGQNTGVGSLSLLQGIFPNQRLNPGLLHCRRILYQLSHKGSPRILEWVAYPFSRGSGFQPRIKVGSPALQVGSLLTEINHGGNIYTMEIGKPYKLRFFS